MTRTPLVAGNWKMVSTLSQCKTILTSLIRNSYSTAVEVIVAPPFPALYPSFEQIKESSIRLAAQNMYFEKQGAFTGEVSGEMLKELGCSHVILGHSERRALFAEKNEEIAKKVEMAMSLQLIPIICVGENLEQRKSNITKYIIKEQLDPVLHVIRISASQNFVIAYEPVWAIGTGNTATPEQAEDVHAFIRELFATAFGKEFAQNIRIIYGGSIKADNAQGLFSKPNIDGGLVGGASLDPSGFYKIIQSAVSK